MKNLDKKMLIFIVSYTEVGKLKYGCYGRDHSSEIPEVKEFLVEGKRWRS
jgi:hypothetical protein